MLRRGTPGHALVARPQLRPNPAKRGQPGCQGNRRSWGRLTFFVDERVRPAPKVTVTRERVSLCQKGVTLWLLFLVNCFLASKPAKTSRGRAACSTARAPPLRSNRQREVNLMGNDGCPCHHHAFLYHGCDCALPNDRRTQPGVNGQRRLNWGRETSRGTDAAMHYTWWRPLRAALPGAREYMRLEAETSALRADPNRHPLMFDISIELLLRLFRK